MEGSKNAMYAQAGRSRGWTQGLQENMPPRTAQAANVPAPPVVPAPVAESAPNVQARAIPEPSAPMLPIMPVIEAPAADLPAMPVAEIPTVMMPAAAEMGASTMFIPTPIPPCEEQFHPFKGCETPVMAYIPMQRWGDLYEPEQGFSRGTIFAKLDLPFIGEGACRRE